MNEYKAIFLPDAVDTYYRVSEGLMIAGFDGDMGKGDAIGRSFEAYIAYNEISFPEKVWNLWEKDEKGKYRGVRFPGYSYEQHPMSRDHTLYTMFLLFYSRHQAYRNYSRLIDFIKNTPWLIDKNNWKHWQTPGIYFWKHAIIGRKFHKFMYYLTAIVTTALRTFTESIFRKLFGIKPERTQRSWDKDYPPSVSKGKRRRMRLFLSPVYALAIKGWMLSCLPDSNAKNVMKWLCNKQAGKTNYMLHMLFGRPVDKMNLLRYQPMTGGRFTTSLDIRNDRHCVIIKNKVWIQYNRLDKDLVLAMFNMKF